MRAPPRLTRRTLGRWPATVAFLALLPLLALPGAAAADAVSDPGPAPGLQLTLDPVLLAHAAPPAAVDLAPSPPPSPGAARGPDLDFDLLGAPSTATAAVDDSLLRRRRTMLNLHQKVGLGLLGLQLATTVVGQLNYSDKYGANPPVTGRYQLTHGALAYATLAAFAVNGAIAIFTPPNPVRKEGWDRTTVHTLGMALAAAGMITQGALGVYAHQREGRLDQPRIARTHLVIGYATLVAVGVAVGAMTF